MPIRYVLQFLNITIQYYDLLQFLKQMMNAEDGFFLSFSVFDYIVSMFQLDVCDSDVCWQLKYKILFFLF